MAGNSGEKPPAPLVTVTSTASPQPVRLFMSTNNPSAASANNESLFYAEDGSLVYRQACPAPGTSHPAHALPALACLPGPACLALPAWPCPAWLSCGG